MRPGRIAVLCLLILLVPSPAPAQGDGEELTLAAALAGGETDHPELRAAAAALEAARARLLAARIYPHNPEIEIEGDRRRGPAEETTDRGLSLSQELEIAGQRGRRKAAAGADLAAAQAAFEHRRRLVLGRVESAYATAVRDRELRAVAATDLELTRSLLALAEERLAAGAGNQIEVNLARAAAGRASRGLLVATAAWHQARSRLAEALGAARTDATWKRR